VFCPPKTPSQSGAPQRQRSIARAYQLHNDGNPRPCWDLSIGNGSQQRSPARVEAIVKGNEMILRPRDMGQTEMLNLRRHWVIPVEVSFTRGIIDTLLKIGSGQIWAGNQQR